MVLGAGPAHALYFGFYEMTKETLTKFTSHNHLNYGLFTIYLQYEDSLTNLICCFFSSHFGLFGDSAARCHIHSDGGDKATHANVQLSVYLGHQMHTGRVLKGGSARLLSLVWHTARHEYTISDDSFYHI